MGWDIVVILTSDCEKSALVVFNISLHFLQIPIEIIIILNNAVWKSTLSKQYYIIPEPTCINIPVFLRTAMASFFPIPRSPLGQPPFPCPCCEILSGTLHLVLEPLVQLKPSTARWFGHIVIELRRSELHLKIPALHKIKSISFSGPTKLRVDTCYDISFVHNARGIISVLRFLSFWSKPQTDPTRERNEQLPSIFEAVLTL